MTHQMDLALRSFFPTLEHRRLVKRLPLNFVTTQFLTGHGKFRQYLHRFRLVGDPSCECGELQTSHHLLLDCPIFESVRCRLRRDVAQSIQEEDLVQELVETGAVIHRWLVQIERIAAGSSQSSSS